MSESRLTKTQLRALKTIRLMHDGYEGIAHDLVGDLSMTSRNWPATAAGLERRGLIEGHYDSTRPHEEAWSYTMTEAGRSVLASLEARNDDLHGGEIVAHGFEVET